MRNRNAGYIGYCRIYRDGSGNTFAEDTPVFGGQLGGSHQGHDAPKGHRVPGEFKMYDDMGFEYDDVYGGYDELGSEFPMAGMYDQSGAFGAAVPQLPMRRPALPMRGRAAASRGSKGKWQKTVLTGQATAITGGTQWNITIRPQFDFVAQDVAFDGSSATIAVNSIVFGDYQVFNNATGVPIAVLNVGGFIRGIVKGAKIRGGLDIQLTGVDNAAATVTTDVAIATFVGLKPQTGPCA